MRCLLLIVAACVVSGPFVMGSAWADPVTPSGQTVLADDFQRDEATPGKEGIGNGWSTNSKSRAQGNQQVDLVDGAMHIYRHAVADHGVSVVHDFGFRDGEVRLRFKLGPKDDLGINIADMDEKSVHAGHLCMARIRNKQVELIDLKTGRMKLEMREANKAKSLTAEQKARLATKIKKFPVDLKPDQWHDLLVKIQGETMTVLIDGSQVGEFSSPGIGHPTKKRLRLAVNRQAWIDDVRLIRNR